MSTTIPASSDAADEAEFRRILADIDKMRAEMRQDDVVMTRLNADIAALEAESRLLQRSADDHIQQTFAVLDSLQAGLKA